MWISSDRYDELLETEQKYINILRHYQDLKCSVATLEEKYINEKQARLQLLSMMPDAEKVEK